MLDWVFGDGQTKLLMSATTTRRGKPTAREADFHISWKEVLLSTTSIGVNLRKHACISTKCVLDFGILFYLLFILYIFECFSKYIYEPELYSIYLLMTCIVT